MLSCKTNKIMLRAVCVVLVCGLLLSGIGISSHAVTDTASDFALAPPLATKPPCEIRYNETTETCDVVTNNDVIETWDKETVRSVRQGEILGKAFRNRWAFVDVGYLIEQMLILTQQHKLHNPKDILIPLLKKHIQNRNGMAEIRLEGFEIDKIEEVRKSGEIAGFVLPVTRNGTPAYRLICNLQNGETSIPMKDGTNVYIKVETVIGSDMTEKKNVVTTPQAESDNDKYRKQFIGENRAWLKELGFTELGLAGVQIKPNTGNLANFGFRRGVAQLPLIMNECRKLIRQKLKEQTKHYEFYIYSAGLGEEPEEAVEFIRAFCDVLKGECGDVVRDWDIYVVGLDANDSPVQNSNKIFEQEEKELRRKGFKVSMRAICADVKNRHTLLIIRDGIGETKRADIILNRHIHYGNALMGDDKERFRLNDMGRIFDVYMQIRSLIDVFGKEGGLYITEEQNIKKGIVCRHLIIPGTEVIPKDDFRGTGIYKIINPHINLPVNKFANGLNIELHKPIMEEIIRMAHIHATNVQDTLTYIQAQPQSQPLIVALGTSWIKGYERERYLQYDALNPLIGSIRTYCESKGIPFIVEEDDKLLAHINAERSKGGRIDSKVVVLAGENTVKSDDFELLRNDEKNAFVVGVNNQELTTDSYIRLMEMLTLALKLSAGMDASLDNIHITITKDSERHLYIFLPHAEPMDYERLKVIYEVQKFA